MINVYLSGSFIALAILCLYSEDWDFKPKPLIILMSAVTITSWFFVIGAIINREHHRSSIKFVYDNLKDKFK